MMNNGPYAAACVAVIPDTHNEQQGQLNMEMPRPANDNAIDPLLKLARVIEFTGLSSSNIYRQMEAGTFPRPLRLGPNSVRWRTSHIIAWTDSLITSKAAA